MVLERGHILDSDSNAPAESLQDPDLATTGPPEDASGPPAAPEAARLFSGAPEKYRRIGVGMAGTDWLCMASALVLSYLLRWKSFDMALSYVAVVALVPFAWVAVYRLYSLHSPQLLSSWEEFRRTVSASSVGMVVVIMGSYWTKASLSRIWVGSTWALVLLFELVSRRLWRKYVGRQREAGSLALRTLVVGSNGESKRLIEALRVHGSGFEPIGFVSGNGAVGMHANLRVVGGLGDLSEAIHNCAADCLFVEPSDLNEKQMLSIIKLARQKNVEVHVSANLPEILSPRLTVQPLEGIMALSLRPVRLSGGQATLKRAFDLALTIPTSVLLAPLFALICIAIKMNSHGPVLFKQYRVTKGGRTFTMYKFRTMKDDADDFLRENEIDPSAPFFKMGDNDPRLTSVGRFLRRWSLDELPQLLNVLRGDMSLVGPRPLPADQVAANLELLGPRHEVPAGMTGWWQIQGRSDVDPDDSVRLDLFYIENWSLALDVYVLLKTAGVVVAGKGAY
jgi:exopolysaccharide biosynthesis polyprenyl glycosylphosphotransferase